MQLGAKSPETSLKKGGDLEMDIHVGIWRGRWPKDLQCIINIEDNLLVRYDSKDHVLDMVEFDPKERTVCAVAEIALGELELPPFHSVHHFLSKGEPFLFCLATDRKRYVIFRAAGKRFGPPTSGSLIFSPSHCVVFKYRNLHYLLCYSSRSGEYQVLSMGPLCNPKMDIMSATVAQGRFRPGWTDVIWKGTTHLRCTRQKFFCYNCETGEVAFECVWVRGASTSSSIVSQDHVTMSVGPPPPSDKPESDLQKILKKKGCVAMPLHIAGRTVCLLYSHSAMARDGPGKSSTGSSRLPSSGSRSQPPNQAASAAAVAESSAVLLQKRVFANETPWSHFCMLQDRSDAQGGDLLCYSSTKGDVWVSQLFACKEGHSPTRDVTLRDDVGKEDDHASGDGGLGGSHRVVKFSQEQHDKCAASAQPRGDESINVGSGGGKGRQSLGGIRQLTTQTLRQVAEIPVDIDDFAAQAHMGHDEDYSFPIDDENGDGSERGSRGGGSRKGRSRQHDQSRGGENESQSNSRSASQQSGRNKTKKDRPSSSAFRNPVSPRPVSSGRSVRQRLAEMETTGDYHTDIARYVKHLQNTDFAADSPTSKVDLADIISSMTQPTEKELLAGTGGSVSSSQRAQSARGYDRSGKMPWRSCLGDHEFLPSKWLNDLEAQFEIHRETEVPDYRLSEKAVLRLHHPPVSREQYQQKHINASVKELREAEVSYAGRLSRDESLDPLSPEKVKDIVTRLAVGDIESRDKKKASRDKKYLAPVQPEPRPVMPGQPARDPVKEKFNEDEMNQFVRRLGVDGVQRQRDGKKRAEEKAHKPLMPPHPPLRQEELVQINDRLTNGSKDRRAAEKAKVLAAMDKGVFAEPNPRSPDQVRFASKRLYLGKTEAQANEMQLEV